MMEVLKLLLIPNTCYHTALENFFEVKPEPNKPNCGRFCSYCGGTTSKFTGLFYRRQLMSILATKVNRQSKVTPSQFMKTLKASKSLFHPKHKPSKETGTKPYHGLVMQLIASGIIGLQVMDTTKLGTKTIANNDLAISNLAQC